LLAFPHFDPVNADICLRFYADPNFAAPDFDDSEFCDNFAISVNDQLIARPPCQD
jgi:hypothetical protein